MGELWEVSVGRATNRLAIMSLISLPVVAMSSPAGASATAPTVRVVASRLGPNLMTPKAKIVGEGKTAFYSPDTLTVPEDTVNDCSTGFVSFKIVNTGTRKAYVTSNGGGFTLIVAGASANVCFSGGKAGDQLTFGLSNKTFAKTYTATLVVTLSD